MSLSSPTTARNGPHAPASGNAAAPPAPPPVPAPPEPPSPTGANGAESGPGRDPTSGRFTPGNRCAMGNPHARRVAQLRNALFEVATPDAMRRVTARLVALAEGGDLRAAELLLRYTLGRPRAEANDDEVQSG